METWAIALAVAALVVVLLLVAYYFSDGSSKDGFDPWCDTTTTCVGGQCSDEQCSFPVAACDENSCALPGTCENGVCTQPAKWCAEGTTCMAPNVCDGERCTAAAVTCIDGPGGTCAGRCDGNVCTPFGWECSAATCKNGTCDPSGRCVPTKGCGETGYCDNGAQCNAAGVCEGGKESKSSSGGACSDWGVKFVPGADGEAPLGMSSCKLTTDAKGKSHQRIYGVKSTDDSYAHLKTGGATSDSDCMDYCVAFPAGHDGTPCVAWGYTEENKNCRAYAKMPSTLQTAGAHSFGKM